MTGLRGVETFHCFLFLQNSTRRAMKGWFFESSCFLSAKWDWVSTCCWLKGNLLWYKMSLGVNMLFCEGQIPLLQHDFCFLKVFQPPKHWHITKLDSNLLLHTTCRAQPHSDEWSFYGWNMGYGGDIFFSAKMITIILLEILVVSLDVQSMW